MMGPMAVTSFGYFLYPPTWLGASPLEGTPEDPRSTWDPVVTAVSLPESIEVTCIRNGLFRFDLAGWALGAPIPRGKPPEPGVRVERIRWRTVLMNAHLACLYTAQKRIDDRRRAPMVVTPRKLMNFQEDGGTSVIDAPELGELLRLQWTSLSPRPAPTDWRFARLDTVSVETIQHSFELLRPMITADGQLLSLVALALKSAAAHDAQDFDAGLIQSWALVERLLTTLWRRYVEENQDRELDGVSRRFIGARRKKFLTDPGPPVAVVSEFLSILELLPFDFYNRLEPIRKARNRWTHSLKPAGAEHSAASLSMALDLLGHVHGVHLELASDTMLMSGV